MTAPTMVADAAAAVLTGGTGVWVMDVGADASDADLHVLSPEEHANALELRPGTRRTRYIRSHAGLRHVLAEVTGLDPAALRLERDADGRPRLADGGPDFNLSYDGTTAAVAVADGHRVGVDVMAPRDMERLGHVARAAFCPAERHRLAGDGPGIQRTFAAKEAYLKLLGCGLRRPPRDIEVRWGDDGGMVRDGDARAVAVRLTTRRRHDRTVVVLATPSAVSQEPRWQPPAGEELT